MKKLTKALSWVLLVCMLCALLPLEALAAGTAPAAPAVTVSNYSDGKIKVSWKAVKGATAYQVYRATSKTGKYTKVCGTKDLVFKDTYAAVGKTYYYKVRSLKGKTKGSFCKPLSGKAIQKPAAPKGLKAVLTDKDTAVKLSWNRVQGVTSYIIYRSEAKTSGTYTKIGSTTDLTFTDTTADGGKTYWYKVRAKKGVVNGAVSKSVSVSLPLPKPGAPVIAVASGENGLTVSYDAVKYAKTYIIYRSTSKTGTYEKIGSTTKLKYTDTGVKSGKKYFYKVKTKNATGSSGFSNVKSGKFTATVQPAPEVVPDRALEYVNELPEKNLLSESALRETLLNAGYTAEEVQYALDNAGVDWSANALKQAEAILADIPCSKAELTDKLTGDHGFTAEEAQKAADKIDFAPVDALRAAIGLISWGLYTKDEIRSILTEDYGCSAEATAYAMERLVPACVRSDAGYLSGSTISKARYVDSLTSLGFPEAEVKAAVEQIDVSWKDNALRCASELVLNAWLNKDDIYRDLTNVDAFTEAEAAYAMERLPKVAAQQFAENDALSKAELYDRMLRLEFTEAETKTAVGQVNVSWKDNALRRAAQLAYGSACSAREIRSSLTDSFGFTAEEVQYAMDNLDVDWNSTALSKAVSLLADYTCTQVDQIPGMLTEEYGFDDGEVRYAMEHLAPPYAEYIAGKSISNGKLFIINWMEAIGFTPEEAAAAADGLTIDWNARALEYAHVALKKWGACSSVMMAYYLSGFSDENIAYVVSQFDWNAQALALAKALLNDGYTVDQLFYEMTENRELFTEDEVQYALNRLAPEYAENAVSDLDCPTPNLVADALRDDGFNSEAISYALDNYDWQPCAVAYADNALETGTCYSPATLTDELMGAGFSAEDAAYGVNNADPERWYASVRYVADT